MKSIQRLRLDNFLSFAPGSEAFDLQSLNVLIGPNGSGKSNLIEAFTGGSLPMTKAEGGPAPRIDDVILESMSAMLTCHRPTDANKTAMRSLRNA